VAKLNKRAKARNPRIEAAQLLGKWTSLAQGHVLMGGNCSCGLGAGSLRIEEFEQQILDYLDGKHALRERGSLSALLRSIMTDAAQAESGDKLSVLDDLKRTLESFEEVHRG
jgi:hypothetical protein